jgi:serine/threonine-protein kinase
MFCPTDGSPLQAADETDDLVGCVIADRYLITEKLGSGGMGTVYCARHVRTDRQWAIKVMHPALAHDHEAVARFNREAMRGSEICHEHVVEIIDYGETSNGLVYLAMEYVDGEPLSKLLDREGALPPARAATIATQVADALGAAHERGVVHRDLKPDNIMLARRRDGADWVKVVDFGIAKAMQGDAQKVTRTGFILGTPEYMSPEQLAAETLDGRSDIYALGLVTFHMLTGRLPFPGTTPHEAMLRRLTEPPHTLSEMRSDIDWPPALQAVIDRSLARAPTERYATAPEFARDLTTAISHWRSVAGTSPADHPPAESRPAESRPSAPRPTARRRTIIIGAAVVSTAVLALAVIVLLPRMSPRVHPARDLRASAPPRTRALTAPRGAIPAAVGPDTSLGAAASALGDELARAERHSQAAEYQAADQQLAAVRVRLQTLVTAYPHAPELDTLTSRFVRVQQQNRDACETDGAMLRRRGKTPPPCEAASASAGASTRP